MAELTITSKRQATLPVDLCEELGLKRGDRVRLERRRVGGEEVWVLRGNKPDWSWFGAARRYAGKKSHRWSDVRRSIEKGWRESRT